MSNESSLSLVDFYADWCGPCRMLHPILDKIQSQNPGLEIVKINVDADREKASEHGIRSLPTVLLMKGDSVLETIKGLKPEGFYQDLIKKHS